MTTLRGVAARVARLRRTLSERDLLVLGSLHRLRLLTSDHVARLHLADGSTSTRPRRTRAVLRRLADLGLIVRLGRTVGGPRAGSASTVYTLSGLGQAVVDTSNSRRRRALWRTSPYFRDHMLAVSELYVRLTERCRGGRSELVAFDAEPRCWRSFVGPAGGVVPLKPDAYARIGHRDLELVSFIEVDLGTESLPTIQRKCQTYLAYWRTGAEQQERGVFPRVIWLVPDERRREGIATVLRRLTGNETLGLFAVATLEHGPRVLTTVPSDAGETISRGGRP